MSLIEGNINELLVDIIKSKYYDVFNYSYESRLDLYRALCNNTLYKEGTEGNFKAYSISWRSAGHFASQLTTENYEDYMDYYCGGKEGEILPDIEEILNNLGYYFESLDSQGNIKGTNINPDSLHTEDPIVEQAKELSIPFSVFFDHVERKERIAALNSRSNQGD